MIITRERSSEARRRAFLRREAAAPPPKETDRYQGGAKTTTPTGEPLPLETYDAQQELRLQRARQRYIQQNASPSQEAEIRTRVSFSSKPAAKPPTTQPRGGGKEAPQEGGDETTHDEAAPRPPCYGVSHNDREADRPPIRGAGRADAGLQTGDERIKNEDNFASGTRSSETGTGDLKDFDFRGLAIPTRTRRDLSEWCTALAENESYMHLACMLVARLYVDKGSGKPLLSETIVRQCFGESTTYQGGGDRPTIEQHLEAYQESVDPAFDWSGYHPSKGLARVCTAHGIPERILERHDEAMMEHFEKEFLLSGKKANDSNRRAMRKEMREEYEAYAPELDPPKDALQWARYLNGRSPRTFNALHERWAEARLAASRLPSRGRSHGAISALDKIALQPKPLYRFGDRTARLQAPGSITNLDSEIRPILYPDERWIELDLSKAQLAIAAKEWAQFDGISEEDLSVTRQHLRGHLSGEIDLWEELMQAAGLEGRAGKYAIKRGTYAVVYGGGITQGVGNAFRDGYKQRGGQQPPSGAFDGFREHPVISELLSVRERILSLIREEGKVEDCFGREIPFAGGDNPERSVLAVVAQSREMHLMRPLLEAAQEEAAKSRAAFQIVLYQFDGVTIRVRQTSRIDSVVSRLTEAVNEHAASLGYLTRLARE